MNGQESDQHQQHDNQLSDGGQKPPQRRFRPRGRGRGFQGGGGGGYYRGPPRRPRDRKYTQLFFIGRAEV